MSDSNQNPKPIVYGAHWCPYCNTLESKLQEMGVEFEYKNVDEDGVREEMNQITDGNQTIPVLFVGEDFAVNPDDARLKSMLSGANQATTKPESAPAETKEAENADEKVYPVIMIGAGPANLAAAIYTTREDIETVLLEKGVIGGLAAITDVIDNYPGFEEGIAGADLAMKLEKQAERFGAQIEFAEVSGLDRQDEGLIKVATTDGDKLAKSVLIGTGSDHRKLGLESEEKYFGRGVHYCATCDGAFYRDKKLVVVGGGNSAAQEALFLTKFASHIDLLVRKDAMRASDVLVEKVQSDPKISIHYNTEVEEFIGAEVDGMDKIVKAKIIKDGQPDEIQTDGAFIFIGLIPNTQFLKDTDVKLDEAGFVICDEHLRTSIEGVFVAGDVRSGSTAQIASAVGEGAVAALRIREYLEK